MKVSGYKQYAPTLVRWGIGIVFLWIGIDIWVHTNYWITWLPQLAFQLPVDPKILILMNGTFDALFGALLLLGLFTRVSAFLMALHLIFVVISLGYNDIAVRDFGLLLATVGIFLHGTDKLCWDNTVRKRLKRYKFLYYFG